jgi:hypothetical protein
MKSEKKYNIKNISGIAFGLVISFGLIIGITQIELSVYMKFTFLLLGIFSFIYSIISIATNEIKRLGGVTISKYDDPFTFYFFVTFQLILGLFLTIYFFINQ